VRLRYVWLYDIYILNFYVSFILYFLQRNCSEFLLIVLLVYSTGVASGQNVVIEMELMALGRRNPTSCNKNKKVVRKKVVERPESELSQLQLEIISFLGQLDSITCLALLKDPQQEENVIPWATCLQQPLVFSLPFKDMKLNINLGVWVVLSSRLRPSKKKEKKTVPASASKLY
jgi:hypothetical protein